MGVYGWVVCDGGGLGALIVKADLKFGGYEVVGIVHWGVGVV